MNPAPSETGSTPVVITGIGVLTPLGDGLEALTGALRERRSAVVARDELGGCGVAAFADFEATRYCNVRGMRLYSRPTQLGICAAKLALADAGLDGPGLDPGQLGFVTGGTFGHLETLLEYDRSVVANGPLRGNPALMPLALPSSPGAASSLSFVAKAFSIGLADGGTSSLDALALGARLLEGRRARACVVIGAFGLCPELSLASWRAGLLGPADAARPFDRQRRGAALGEAGVAVVLERLDEARTRGARPRARLSGHGSAFATEPSRVAAALQRAGAAALRSAGLRPADIGLVSAGAAGSPEGDRVEAQALLGLLGDGAPRTAVTAVKGNLGDSVDASGLLQVLVAMSSLRDGKAPPIAGLEAPELPGLRYLTEETPLSTSHALVTSTSQSGSCSAAVISAE
jgi:3-oxoacyl-[acyl-carrier-protein] synthase II